MMKKYYFFLLCLATLLIGLPSMAQQVMMQGFYWDYPKVGQGYNWSDTLRLKAAALGTAGITHVWFPPFAGNGNKSGGYDPKDWYIGTNTTQSSLGTKLQIKAMVDEFTARNITAVADMVYNHRDAGSPETAPPVKDYILNYAGSNNSSRGCYREPFPSDRYRMVIPIGGSSAQGVGEYVISMKSRSNTYSTHKYMFHVTTQKIGGSRWSPIITPDVDLTGGDISTQTATLGRNYKNRIDSDGDIDNFKVVVNTADFNAAGDFLVIEAINTESGYSNHCPISVKYDSDGAGSNPEVEIADISAPFATAYKLEFQTYTNFSAMPSGAGAMTYRSFRPNWSGSDNLRQDGVNSEEPSAGASTTCLGPQYGLESLDYFYDIDHTRKEANDGLIDWTKWAYDYLGAKGLRLDAIKHFETNFVSRMIKAMHSAGKTPNFLVGEWYGNDYSNMSTWLTSVYAGMSVLGVPSNAVDVKVFDFPLRASLKDACDNNSDPRNVWYTSGNCALRERGFNGRNVVTMVNNHDFRSANVSYNDALIHNDPILAYAYILTNNQLGVPSIFYPDYYGYPARNSNFGGDVISFDYHPTGLSPMKTQINQLIYLLKTYINGSTSVDYLNYAPASPTDYKVNSAPASKALIYQLNANGTSPGKEVIVAINFDNTLRLMVDHKINDTRSGIQRRNLPGTPGTIFTDILAKSANPYGVVDEQGRIYIDLPARSYSVWVQGTLAPLPVELLDFQAVAEQQGIKLAWATNTEKNFKNFEIQRSMDAVDFKTISSVLPKGNDQEGATYSYIDHEAPRNETLYYRLKMNDLDGSFDFSKLKSVRLEDNRLLVTVTPNPTTGSSLLQLSSAEPMPIQIKLYNTIGQEVFGVEQSLRQGNNTIPLPTERLNAGVYEAIISDGTRKWVKRVIKL